MPEFTHLDEQGSARMVDVTDKTVAKTGVEMEALCAVSMAALTVYDMCKAVNRSMTTAGIRLIEKTGGKSGAFVRDDPLTRLRYQHAT